jgi:hypothetical protein
VLQWQTLIVIVLPVWPSLSADTLTRLHNMLLEQPHLTVQHVEILAGHFGVDKKHMENFIEWRNGCLQGCHVGQEQQCRPLPPNTSSNDAMDADEADSHSNERAHLPTPAGSISPEPARRKSPALFVQKHHRPNLPSVDTNYGASGGHGVTLLLSPTSAISPHLQSRPLQGPSNMSPTQASPRGQHSPSTKHLTSPPLHEQLSHLEPTNLLPPSSPNLPDVLTEASLSRLGVRQRQPIRSGAPATSLSARQLPSLPPIPTPRTLRDFEEAYAPTYARIERFLRNVERGKLAHIGLTPEMLKKIDA